MHIHNVYYWLTPGLDNEALASFEQGLDSLIHNPPAKGGHFGKPAATAARDVVESSYTYGMMIVFADLAAHDRYQSGAVHIEFINAHSAKWERVVVYDIEQD